MGKTRKQRQLDLLERVDTINYHNMYDKGFNDGYIAGCKNNIVQLPLDINKAYRLGHIEGYRLGHIRYSKQLEREQKRINTYIEAMQQFNM